MKQLCLQVYLEFSHVSCCGEHNNKVCHLDAACIAFGQIRQERQGIPPTDPPVLVPQSWLPAQPVYLAQLAGELLAECMAGTETASGACTIKHGML